MTDVEAVVQRYYGDRPVLQRIDDALRAAGVDPERPGHCDLWPFDQLHSPGTLASGLTAVLADDLGQGPSRARLRVRMFARERSAARAAVLLKAGGAQAGKAMRLVGALPGAKLLLGKLVALAGFLEGDSAALHGGYDRRLAVDHPSGVGRRQLTH